jgi:hypothetical protein
MAQTSPASAAKKKLRSETRASSAKKKSATAEAASRMKDAVTSATKNERERFVSNIARIAGRLATSVLSSLNDGLEGR